jgi:low affinity Fe/Cu permease
MLAISPRYIKLSIMSTTEQKHNSHFFEKLAGKATAAAGSTHAIIGAFLIVVIWAISAPFFHYSTSWQTIITTGTTIITFLMVFLIQKSQNKDSLAIQLKLNELLATHELASNRLVDVENMTEDELQIIKKYYGKINELSRVDGSIHESHSIEEEDLQHAADSLIDTK